MLLCRVRISSPRWICHPVPGCTLYWSVSLNGGLTIRRERRTNVLRGCRPSMRREISSTPRPGSAPRNLNRSRKLRRRSDEDILYVTLLDRHAS